MRYGGPVWHVPARAGPCSPRQECPGTPGPGRRHRSTGAGRPRFSAAGPRTTRRTAHGPYLQDHPLTRLLTRLPDALSFCHGYRVEAEGGDLLPAPRGPVDQLVRPLAAALVNLWCRHRRAAQDSLHGPSAAARSWPPHARHLPGRRRVRHPGSGSRGVPPGEPHQSPGAGGSARRRWVRQGWSCAGRCPLTKTRKRRGSSCSSSRTGSTPREAGGLIQSPEAPYEFKSTHRYHLVPLFWQYQSE